uniref:Uncharacterized protein n=1 Tax=Picea sitchensis TaxID=3332 RepID=A0A6B9XV08_PICSI|nr:hypothetical protein Q903MT_gene3858 [Picea sitchensis]
MTSSGYTRIPCLAMTLLPSLPRERRRILMNLTLTLMKKKKERIYLLPLITMGRILSYYLLAILSESQKEAMWSRRR